MILLDTDVLTLVQRGESAEYHRLTTRLKEHAAEPVCVTVISFEEQVRGWMAWIARARSGEKLIQGYARLQGLLEDFSRWPILPFDASAAEGYERLRKSRIRVGTMDLRIAAIAITRDATLISRNLGDFQKVPGLRVEDWTKTIS